MPTDFEYRSPETIEEALELLVKYREDARILSGGHGLIPALKERVVSPAVVIDLCRVPGLDAIEAYEDGGLRIGARVTHRSIESSEVIAVHAPLLAGTASQVGDPQVRNFGTLVGSICHADPAADYPATLLVLEALVVIASPRGERLVPIDAFLQGAQQTALEPDELVIAVDVPRDWPQSAAYVKVPRSASGFALAGVAAQLVIEKDVVSHAALAVTGACERAFLSRELARDLLGHAATGERIHQAAQDLCAGLDVIDGPDASAEYRSHLVDVCARRALIRAARSG